MSKRSADTQLTKDDMSNGFNFGGDMDGTTGFNTPPPAANADAMSKRKIAPLKSRRGRGGASFGGRTTQAPDIPNVFAGIGTASFTGSGTNGTPAPAAQPGFGFGSPAAPSTPTGFGNGNTGGGFGFGQQQEQPTPKPNLFGGLAPSPAPTNGNSGGMFGSNSFGSSTPVSSANGMFGNNTATTGANTASTPAASFGGFGTPVNNTSKTSSSFTFGGSTTPAPTPSAGGMFGSNNAETPKPFTFGMPADKKPEETKTPSFTFGASTSTPAPATEAPKAPAFTFGGSTPAPPVTFGASTTTNDAKPSTGFGFGQSPAPSAGASLFGKPAETKPAESAPGSSLFGRPTPSPEPTSLFGKPTPSPEPTSAGNPFDQKPAEKPASTLFGTPVEKGANTPPVFGGFGASTSKPADKKTDEPAKPMFGFGATPAKEDPKPLFGFGATEKKEEPKPAAAPPAFGGFGASTTEKKAEAAPPAFGGFGASTNEKSEAAPPAFGGFGASTNEKKAEAAPPAFGGFGASTTEKKTETAAPAFGGFGASTSEKKAEAAPPAFGGFGASTTEKKTEAAPSSMFSSSFGSGSTTTGSLFGQPKAAEKPANAFSTSTNSMGSNSTNTNSFGFKPSEPTPAANSMFAPKPSVDVAPVATNDGRTSPPLPADSHNWSGSQLTEYYNLFAIRSLNHHFKEAISKADVMADLSILCEKYQEEAKKISQMIANNQRYKFGEGSSGSAIPGKRSASDSNERNSKRTRPLGEESQKASSFAASPGKSSSSQALASILSGVSSGNSDSVSKLAAQPAYSFKPPTSDKVSNAAKLATKPAFGFTPPGAVPAPSKEAVKKDNSPAGWVSPFQKADTSDLPDDPVPADDDDDDESTPQPSGGLFGRISTPKDENKSSIFSNSNDQTWSPDKGFKFSSAETSSPKSSLFPKNSIPPTGTTGSLFGSPALTNSYTGPAAPFTFTPKPSAAPSTATSTSASENEAADGEPSDTIPAGPSADSDLARKRGEGEEDEDVTYETKSILYDFTGGKAEKKGVGIFRVLKNRSTGKGRILLRSEGGGKVLLNVGISKNINYQLRDRCCLVIPDFGAEGGRKTWGCRVGKSGNGEQMKNAVATIQSSLSS
ncbi:hypothetical protein EDC01DRAFT_233389 [Geopyxis carbonaria]|nr:hypothetical protein EDC01DRAFT_233389 [Geopyxis carbonaria]